MNTLQKITKTKEILIEKFSNHPFYYEDMKSEMQKHNMHPMDFYYFVYANCVDKIRTGVYKINPNINTQSISSVYDTARIYLKKKRKERELLKSQMKNSNEIIIGKTKVMSEQDCVSFLKGLGYKILKPIEPQYKEV